MDKHNHPQTGVLLVNLGTPEAPTPAAVRAFLAEFLADRRVIDLPRWFWLPLLHGIILRRRPGPVAANYAALWTHHGDSPLRLVTLRQVAALQALFDTGEVCVAHAFTYGRPSLARVIEGWHAAGIRRATVLPLYPQFSWTTTGSVIDQLGVLRPRWPDMQIDLVERYAEHPTYLDALAQSVRAFWQANGPAERLLVSFHGVPQRYVERGDPYQRECLQTASALAARLGCAPGTSLAAFQSRFGRAEWIKPYTVEVLREWAAAGVKTVDVVCPSFAADCLETLEEIAVECAGIFRAAGGERLRLVPCLNDDPAHVRMMHAIVSERL